MTIETEMLRADLRALMASPQLGVPDYGADPIVQRRVGHMLDGTARRTHAAQVEGSAQHAV